MIWRLLIILGCWMLAILPVFLPCFSNREGVLWTVAAIFGWFFGRLSETIQRAIDRRL